MVSYLAERAKGERGRARENSTRDGESLLHHLGSDVDASSPLRVVCSTQAGDVRHAALVDVHHAVWEDGNEKKDKNHRNSLNSLAVRNTFNHVFSTYSSR